jgi:hypothetical protein
MTRNPSVNLVKPEVIDACSFQLLWQQNDTEFFGDRGKRSKRFRAKVSSNA